MMNPSTSGNRALPGVSAPNLRRYDISDQTLHASLASATQLRFSTDLMSQLLSANKIRFSKGLSYWEAPNVKSAAIIKSGKASWRGKEFILDKNQQEFVLQLSEVMQLDEVQSYHQFQNFLRTEVKGQNFNYERSTLEQICIFFCEERLAILKCINLLLRCASNPTDPFHSVIHPFVTELVQSKLGEEMLLQYRSLSRRLLPATLPRQYSERWATQCVLEQAAVLEIVFLLYYTDVKSDMGSFIMFLDLFHAEGFGTRQVNYSSLPESGRAATKRIRNISTLILLETMSLESYTQPNFVIPAIETLNAVDKKINQLGTTDAHAPIILAWGTILCQIEKLVMKHTQMPDPLPNWLTDLTFYGEHARKGLQLYAIEFMVQLLREEASDDNVLAYKSIVNGFLTTILSAFSVSIFKFNPSVIALHIEIYKDQPILARKFWTTFHSSPESHALVDLAAEYFPHQILPLIQLLTPLAADPQCATTVFEILTNLSTYTQILPSSSYGSIEQITAQDLEMIDFNADAPNSIWNFQINADAVYCQATQQIEIDMITIPVGTVGRIINASSTTSGFNSTNLYHPPSSLAFGTPGGSMASSSNIVTPNTRNLTSLYQTEMIDPRQLMIEWRYPFSAWKLFLDIIDSFLSLFDSSLKRVHISEDDDSLVRVNAIVGLMANLFSQIVGLTDALQDHFNQLVIAYFGGIPDNIDTSIISRLFKIIQVCGALPKPPIDLIVSTLKCIEGIASTHPAEVWRYARRGLIESEEQSPSLTIGPIRRIIEMECTQGSYVVTIAWLDLILALVGYLQRWSNVADISQDEGTESHITTAFATPSGTVLSTTKKTQLQSIKMDTNDFMPCLLYIQSVLFSQYESWKYNSLIEKSQIGLRMLLIFEHLLTDVPEYETSLSSHSKKEIGTAISTPFSTSKKSKKSSSRLPMDVQELVENTSEIELTSQPKQTSSSTLQEYLFNSLLFDVSFHTTLLNEIGAGPGVLEYSKRRSKDGVVFELLVQTAFSVLERVLLLKRRALEAHLGDTKAAHELLLTPLETSLLHRKPGKSGFDLIYIIASYISYNFNWIIPFKATQILTVLCGLSAPGPVVSNASKTNSATTIQTGNSSGPQLASIPISLSAYLGSMVENLRSEFVWKLSDNREPTELRIAILALITETLATQPGLAELFVAISTEPEVMTSKSSVMSVTATTNSLEKAKEQLKELTVPISSVSVVLSLILSDEQREWYLKYNPRLLSEALGMLEALWCVAPDYFAVVGEIRKKAGFWSKLLACLTNDTSHKKSTEESNEIQLESQDITIEHSGCYRTYINARVFKIIALEFFFVPVNGEIDNELLSEITKLCGQGGQQLLNWTDEYTRTVINQHHKDTLKRAIQTLGIDMYSLEHFKSKKVFGREYHFNIPLLKKKLGLFSDQGVMGLEPQVPSKLIAFDNGSSSIDVLESMAFINTELSFIDSRFAALHSWQLLIHMIVLRQPRLQLLDAPVLLKLIKLLTSKISKENRDTQDAINNLQEMSSLLHLLSRHWRQLITTTNASSAPNDIQDFLAEIILSLQSTLAHLSNVAELETSSVIQTLLSVVHLLLKGAPENWKESLYNAVFPIFHTVQSFLEKPRLFSISLSILQTICLHSQMNQRTVLKILIEHNTISLLSQLLKEALLTQTESEKTESIMYFFTAMTNNNIVLAEALISQNFIQDICIDAWVNYVSYQMMPYNANGERNTWHKIWTLSIGILSHLVKLCGRTDQIDYLALEFVNFHQVRILHLLELYSTQYQEISQDSSGPSSSTSNSTSGNIANKKFSLKGDQTESSGVIHSANTHRGEQKKITLAHLEEVEKVSGLLYHLGEFRHKWRLALDNEYNNYSLTNNLEHGIIRLFQRLSHLVSEPSQIPAKAKAVSASERKSLSAYQAATKNASAPQSFKSTQTPTAPSTIKSTTASTTSLNPAPAKTGPNFKPLVTPGVKVPVAAPTDSTSSGENKTETLSKVESNNEDKDPVEGTRNLSQSQTVVRSASQTEVKSATNTSSGIGVPASSSTESHSPHFYQRIELSLYRSLRNTISLVRMFSPKVFIGEEFAEPETLIPVFDPGSQNSEFVLTLGILSNLLTACQDVLQKLCSPSTGISTHATYLTTSYKITKGIPSLTDSASGSKQIPMTSQQPSVSGDRLEEPISIFVYIVEYAVYLLLSHIHIYQSPQYHEVIRRRVREIGSDLDKTLERLIKDWAKLTNCNNPNKTNKFLVQARDYLDTLKVPTE